MKTKFKDLVDNSSYSKGELIKKLNTSKPTFYALYKDEANSIQFDFLKRICEVFNCTPDKFFNISDWDIGQETYSIPNLQSYVKENSYEYIPPRKYNLQIDNETLNNFLESTINLKVKEAINDLKSELTKKDDTV